MATNLKFADVLNYLATCQLTPTETQQLAKAWNANIKRQRTATKETAIAQFRVGQRVSFTARGGFPCTGVIEKVMRVNCWVREDMTKQRFYCPSTCLKIIA
jgi:hypothetical protein